MLNATVARRLVCATVSGATLLTFCLTAPASGQPVEVTSSKPASPDETVGRWHVVASKPTRYTVSWTAPTDIRIGGARPELVTSAGQVLGSPRLLRDGRTLRLTVTAAAPPDVGNLDVVLSGQRLDEPMAPGRSAPRVPYSPLPGTTRLTPDPGVRGDHPVVTSDYELDPVRIPGLSIPVEMVGHVVRAEDADSTSPLVLFLHGKHEICYETPDGTGSGDAYWPCREGTSPVPSHLGYDYVQRLLASQGYVTVSIAANGVNAQDDAADGGAQARALLVRRHLAQWAGWVDAGRYAADLDDVVLVGHSRGGEGVTRAGAITPLTAPYRITGLITIGPTSFSRSVAAYIPSIAVLPYCDGDVIASDGQVYTDLTRDLTADDTAIHSSVMVMGANHNFFNTEWTPATAVAPEVAGDDWNTAPEGTCGKRTPERLTAVEQRQVGKSYLAGAVRLLAGGDRRMLPLFDGSRVSLASTDDADVRSHAVGGGREARVPGRDARLGPVRGATTRICAGYSEPGLILSRRADRESCAGDISSLRTPHWPSEYLRGTPTVNAFEMTWTARDQRGGLRFDEPLDLSGAAGLDLRTVVDVPTGDVRLEVVVHDAQRSVTVSPVGGPLLPTLPAGPISLGKRWAQTLRVSTDDLTGSVDLSAVTGIDLVGRSADGHVWVLDASAARRRLPPVPVERLPRIDIEDARVVEGDGPGLRTIPLPFTLTGDVSRPSRVVVLAQNLMDSSRLRPYATTIAAGVRAGTLDVPYRPDDRDDVGVQQYEMRVFGLRGVVGQEFASTVRLVDDDPRPQLLIERVSKAVSEGESAGWRATLSEPVDYPLPITGRIVAGSTGRPLVTVGDTGRVWRRTHIDPPQPLTTPLHEAGARASGSIDRGDTSVVIEIPFRDDGASEGREAVSLRVSGFRYGPGETRTVLIRDPA